MKFFNQGKKWIWIIAGVLIAGIAAFLIFGTKNSERVFTKSEYIKEVVVQNQNFENLLDDFLNQVSSYDSTKESTEKFEETANKFSKFVTALETKLGPKVPYDSKSHYESMIKAYKLYAQAAELYKKAVPKNLGDERQAQMQEAQNKLNEAKEAMKNLK